jgi:hypothetical protein
MPAKAGIQKSWLAPGFRRGDDIQVKLGDTFLWQYIELAW